MIDALSGRRLCGLPEALRIGKRLSQRVNKRVLLRVRLDGIFQRAAADTAFIGQPINRIGVITRDPPPHVGGRVSPALRGALDAHGIGQRRVAQVAPVRESEQGQPT